MISWLRGSARRNSWKSVKSVLGVATDFTIDTMCYLFFAAEVNISSILRSLLKNEPS
jgi:hypothetical protein